MSQGSSIPEMLGFPSVPLDRQKPYSPHSYQALYQLTEEEAREVVETYKFQPAIDMHLAQRYISDAEYRQRIDEARQDISATEPSEDVKRVMERMNSRGEVA